MAAFAVDPQAMRRCDVTRYDVIERAAHTTSHADTHTLSEEDTVRAPFSRLLGSTLSISLKNKK